MIDQESITSFKYRKFDWVITNELCGDSMEEKEETEIFT